MGAAGSRGGSCTPQEWNQCSRAHRKERSPSTPRRSRPSAGPKALRPPVSPSFYLRPLPTPSELFPRPPRGALTRLSRLLQPPPLLTQTLSAPGVRDPSLSTPPIGRCPYPWQPIRAVSEGHAPLRLRVDVQAGLGEFLHAHNCSLWAELGGGAAQASACAVLLGCPAKNQLSGERSGHHWKARSELGGRIP